MRYGLVALLCLALAGCGTSGVGLASGPLPPLDDLKPRASAPTPTASAATASATATAALTYPTVGRGTFRYATAGGPVAGDSGRLLNYRVAVENGIAGTDANQFATQVRAILGDPHGWTGTGHWRLHQVPVGARYDFTIYLATPATRDRLCGHGRDEYTSCRNGNSVVLNVARWVHGVPGYGADLTTYRSYMVNHETGHRLGFGHQLCPGPGRPAPVMQQQTLGLHGCRANPWPVVDGRLYLGASGRYNDPLPRP